MNTCAKPEHARARWSRDHRSETAQCWAVHINGDLFEVFTNGHFLVAMAVESSMHERAVGKWRSTLEGIMSAAWRWLPNVGGSTINTQMLTTVAGDPPPQHWCIDQEGRLAPARTLVTVNGTQFDQRYVAECVHFVAAGGSEIIAKTAMLPPPASQETDVLLLASGDCLAVLHGCSRETMESVLSIDLE